MTVLVLTRPADATADVVIEELNRRGVPLCRMDPGDFPEQMSLSAQLAPGDARWRGRWQGQHQDLKLGSITAVYYRRPGAFRMREGMAADVERWARDEAQAGVGGVLASLDGCRWINHPHHVALAGVAPRALAEAAGCGLTIPRTLITNSPRDARDFVASLPGGVAAYKPLGRNGPTERDGRRYALWTDRVRAEEITDDVSLTAHLFQEWIAKAFEVRLTAVGEAMFAAQIFAGSEAARIDIRRDYAAHWYEPCAVPEYVCRGVRALLDIFRLHFVALDFLVDRDGCWHLVDVNPNGQWAFIPQLREAITHALADTLEGIHPRA